MTFNYPVSPAQADVSDQGGNTCLMFAAKEGHVSIARLLLKQGANPDKANSYGWPALMQVSDNYVNLS